MRNKARTSKKKGSSKKRNIARNPEASLDELIAAAEAAMASLDIEKAIDLYSKAAALLRMGRTSSSETREMLLIRVLEKMGESKVSLGDQTGAKADLQEALELLEQENEKNTTYHETRSSLFFYVGQLSTEKEALQSYRHGIESLEACYEFTQQENPSRMSDGESSSQSVLHEIQKKLSGGYCTVAELYLTDLCYEDDAESQCELYLEKALQIKDFDGQPLVDSLQTMASLRLSQQSRRQEAVQYILQAFEKMRAGCDALASLVGLIEDDGANKANSNEQATELTEVEAANNLPEFEFRCETAKLLLECVALLQESLDASSEDRKSQGQHCVKAAISVLGSLLAQNDEVVEIWFLTGCAFAAKQPPMIDSALYYLNRAMEMLKEVRKALQKESRFVDEVEMSGIQEELAENKVQIDDVEAKLNELQNSTESMEE